MNRIITSLPLRDQVANILRQMIIAGELAPDSKISERAICSMLNVSTTPVKEALRQLQVEGLVYTIPRKGSYISSSSRENVQQILYLRSAVEGVAAYFAAKNADEHEIAVMEAQLERSLTLIHSKGASQEISRNNNDFHISIRNSAHNDYICNLGEVTKAIDYSVRNYVNDDNYECMLARHLEHAEILRYIKERDSENAERAMIHHIRRTAASLA